MENPQTLRTKTFLIHTTMGQHPTALDAHTARQHGLDH
jgi:hypothetical protein